MKILSFLLLTLYDGILQELELAREIGIYYANDGIKPKFINNNPYKPVKKLWFNR
jgi:hypothetical protein